MQRYASLRSMMDNDSFTPGTTSDSAPGYQRAHSISQSRAATNDVTRQFDRFFTFEQIEQTSQRLVLSGDRQGGGVGSVETIENADAATDTHQHMLSSTHTTRVHWPVNTGVILEIPCSRAVDTAREDGSWTRVVPNLSLQQGRRFLTKFRLDYYVTSPLRGETLPQYRGIWLNFEPRGLHSPVKFHPDRFIVSHLGWKAHFQLQHSMVEPSSSKETKLTGKRRRAEERVHLAESRTQIWPTFIIWGCCTHPPRSPIGATFRSIRLHGPPSLKQTSSQQWWLCGG